MIGGSEAGINAALRARELDPTTQVTVAVADNYPNLSMQKCLNHGRELSDRITPSPRRLTSWITTRPTGHSEQRRVHLDELLAACPEMTSLARLVHEFAQIMGERRGNYLDGWMRQVRDAGLPELDPFLRGLTQDYDAAVAGFSLSYSNGAVEGVNTIEPNSSNDECMAAPVSDSFTASSWPATQRPPDVSPPMNPQSRDAPSGAEPA
ncbi:transposase [Nocardia takedensis]|uniref:transposase n=1 Tax=Nocardia takedensis TaxID=259390 RepID=UPI003F767923